MLSSLNKVFLTIKKHCQDIQVLDGNDCIKDIAKEANLDMELFDVYLFILKNMQLIDYSNNEKRYILLTTLGKATSKISSTLV